MGYPKQVTVIMIRDIVLFCSAILIVIIHLTHIATGNTNLRSDVFNTANTLLNGYECGDGFTVEVKNDFVAESVSKCAQMCAKYFQCVGFYYKSDGNTCQLCNHLFNPVGTSSLAQMVGSRYFGRSECHGWVRGETNLRVYLEMLSRSDAQARCEETGGTLARITDQSLISQISDALLSCASYNINNDYWTDGVYDSTTGTWIYSDGTPMPMDWTVYWEAGAPDSGGNDQCVRLRYKQSVNTYRWNDYSCETMFRFICEYSN